MVVYFNMLGWREQSSGVVSHVAGQELNVVTTSVKTNLTHVHECCGSCQLGFGHRVPVVKVHTHVLGRDAS